MVKLIQKPIYLYIHYGEERKIFTLRGAIEEDLSKTFPVLESFHIQNIGKSKDAAILNARKKASELGLDLKLFGLENESLNPFDANTGASTSQSVQPKSLKDYESTKMELIPLSVFKENIEKGVLVNPIYQGCKATDLLKEGLFVFSGTEQAQKAVDTRKRSQLNSVNLDAHIFKKAIEELEFKLPSGKFLPHGEQGKKKTFKGLQIIDYYFEDTLGFSKKFIFKDKKGILYAIAQSDFDIKTESPVEHKEMLIGKFFTISGCIRRHTGILNRQSKINIIDVRH